MRGIKPFERGMFDDMYWRPEIEHQPGPGRPFTEDERTKLDVLISLGRVAMVQCRCGQLHPVITPAGHEALRLQKLVDTSNSGT